MSRGLAFRYSQHNLLLELTGRDRSVSEVRRVAEELKRKAGSNGIDYLVTSQGQSALPVP